VGYAPIHNHSEYSALDGLSTCKEIAVRCQEIDVEAIGISDHGTVSGHLEFDKVMREHDIKPVFGCELYHGVKTEFGKNERDQAHFLAGAMTDEGLRNLWRLVDKASENFRYVGRTDWESLRKHSDGLFATSACMAGLVSKEIREGETNALSKYLEIFGENFYVELHTYPSPEQEVLNVELVNLARERGIPLVYATDAHFASPDQYKIHDAFVAMQTGENILMPVEDRKMWHPNSLYIQSEDEIRASLSYLPVDVVDEALANSGVLASKCEANLPSVERHLPKFIPGDSPWIEKDDQVLSAAEILFKEVERGLESRYGKGEVSQEVWDRAAAEIEVFLDAGLEHYFLQAWDFVQFCNDHDIKRGPGRGSAAGSMISYALGITDIDPLSYDLIFERFYNPGRAKGFPDIDNDFPTRDREKVKQYMEKRWGKDKVRSIGTVRRMKPKDAVDKTHKVCGVDFERKAQLKKLINEVPDIDILGADSIGWDEEIDPGKTIYVMHSTPQAEHETGKKIEEWVQGITDEKEKKRVERWLDLLRVVCSRVSGYGIHPSGLVVSDVPLEDELPCMWNTSKKTQTTCFPMKDVDRRQFVKQDFLGLANLDILDEWEDMVTPLVGDIDWIAAEKDHESEMWRLLDKGLTLGIFQIEDGYARHLCKEFKPRSIEDLAIIVALNRPGPIRSGAPDSFIRRRNGEEEVSYDHPILEPILEPTLGWFLYQEQVIQFFKELGYNPSDADAVRKILGKKKPEEMQALFEGTGEWKGKGYCEVAFSLLGQDDAQVIWDKIEDFAKYSFNKSHAIAYAVLGFRTLYAKYNSPAHFFIACIRVANIQKKSKEDAGKYVSEARRMGIQVLPPQIGISQPDIDMIEGHIYFGFSNVKGIGKAAGEYICSLRNKYEIASPEDLYNAIEVEQEIWTTEKESAKADGRKFNKKSPRQQLPQNRIAPLHEVGGFGGAELSMKELQEVEKEILGVIITDDCEEVLQQHWEEVEQCDSYKDLEVEGVSAHIPGIVCNVVPKRTRKDNKAMGIVTIEYEGEQVEFVVFPREWKSYRFLWSERIPAIFSLTRTDRGVRFEDAIKLK
jgi:DNA polymerase-3 subunit alpha